MPTRGSTQINTFVKGLLTEASPLAFPPNTALDILNFRLNKDGSIHRRLGIDVEEGGAFYNFNISAEVLATARKSFYRWQNPNGNPNVDIGVVQLGSFFWFINLFAPAPSIALLNGGNPIDAGVDHRTRFSMATINGYLAVVSSALDTPYLVTYNEATDSITYETADIMVRDIWGVDDFMTEYHRPSDLNDEHRYNLRNQGWSPNIITTCGPGIDAVSCTFLTHNIYPSNSDHWSIGRIEDLTSADVYKYDPNIAARNIVEQGQTAKGSMIINLYNRGSSRMALTGINLPLDRDRGRVSTIASYAGRIFYSGIYSDQIGTDARSPKLSNIVLFSQLFINKVDLVKCYQQADPTSIEFSDIIDTDGGLIQIPECGQVTRLMTVKDSLFVFATNGIWRIRGDEGGFRATSFQVDKISNVFCSSPDSIIELNGTIFLWGIDGIYSLVPNDTGMYNTVSLTIPTIQTLYNSLPDISKLQAKGFYDLSQNRLRWLYYSDESKVSGDPIDTPAPGPIVPSTTIGASSTLSESASAIKVARISDTSFCIVYTKGASPSSLKAVVCTFDPITLAVTFGTAVTVRVTATQASVNIYAHDTNKVLIIHTDSPSVNALATVLTISGTSITVGAVNTLFATGGNFASVFPVALSSTKAILTYKPAGTGEARILTIAGNVVTTSSATTIGTATTMGAADKIDSTRVILLYGDGSGNEVVVLSAPSTTITVGTPLNIQAFTVGSLNDMSINVLPSGGRATILGRGTSAQLRQTIISISGTSLTRDSAADYTSVNTTVFNSQWHSILNSNISVCVSNNNDSGTRYPYLEVNKAYTSVINNYISRQLLESLMAANIHTAKITDDKIVWVALNGTSSGNILTQVLQIT